MMSETRKAYPSDVSDTDWEFLAPYLTLMREDAPQREHPLRDLFDGLRYVVRTGCPWALLPHDYSPAHGRVSAGPAAGGRGSVASRSLSSVGSAACSGPCRR